MSDNLSAFRKLLRNKRRTQPIVISYYATEQDWLDVHNYCTDAHVFHTSFAVWKAGHQEVRELLRKSRENCQRTQLTLVAFRAYCTEQRYTPDTNARARYAADMVTMHPELVQQIPWKP